MTQFDRYTKRDKLTVTLLVWRVCTLQGKESILPFPPPHNVCTLPQLSIPHEYSSVHECIGYSYEGFIGRIISTCTPYFIQELPVFWFKHGAWSMIFFFNIILNHIEYGVGRRCPLGDTDP